MVKEPLVYIVLPVYNGQKYLLEQLMSIYYQNYQNWFLIIVNDGSTDHSEEIAEKFVLNYELKHKVKILNKENGGLNSAITRGFEEIKKNRDINISDSLVCYCDCDDIRTREKLSLQAEYMIKNQNCGLSYHDLAIIDENGIIKECSKMKKFKYRDDKNFQIISTMEHNMTATSMMFRGDCIDDIMPMPLGKNMCQDGWTALVLSFLGWEIKYINVSLGYYRVWDMSKLMQLKNNDKNVLSNRQIDLLKFLQSRFPNVNLSNLIRYKEDVRGKNFKNKIEKYVYVLFKHPKIFFIQLRLFLKEKVKFKL